MSKLDDQLARLSDVDAAALREEWERAHRMPAQRISEDLLRLGIAYRLQEKEHGKLSRCSMAALKAAPGSDCAAPSIKPGTRLVRSWNGRTITVEIDESGFLFEDKRYGSLSAIAREVTGTNWSGPRFFGLNSGAAHG